MANDLTVTNQEEWVVLQKKCQAFIASGLMPDHITRNVTPKEAVAKLITIILQGRELKIPPLASINGISVIKGKPCLSAQLMRSLIYQRVPGSKIEFLTPLDKRHLECTIRVQRPGEKPESFRFTMDDAKRADLLRNEVWRKYPSAMLVARATSQAANAKFPDAIMGCYTPEEMGSLEPPPDVEAIEAETKPVDTPETSQKVNTEPKSGEGPPKSSPAQNKQDPRAQKRVTEKQLSRLWAIQKEAGANDEYVAAYMDEEFGLEAVASLNWVQYDQLCNHIKNDALPGLSGEEHEEYASAMERG